MYRKSSQSGYSLIELSMVLVIIGLLVAGLLKGTELINQARLRNISSSLDSLVIAIQTYQDRYRSLPGDDLLAGGRWPSTASSGNGDRLVCGGYDGGEGGAPCGQNGAESLMLWQHLRSAGLLAGLGNQPPEHPGGGIFGVQYGALGLGRHTLCANNLPASIAGSIDRQLDDGLANQGSIRSVVQAGNTVVASTTPGSAAYVEEGSSLYVLCRSL